MQALDPPMRPQSLEQRLRAPARAVLGAAIAVPWLWPWTSGPSPGVLPLLAAWTCLLLAVPGLVLQSHPRRTLAAVVPAAWLIAAVGSAAIGLLQWFGAAPATSLVSAASLGEAYGNLRQKNQFATLTSIGLAVVVFGLPGLRRWSAVAIVAVLACANSASASRTGVLQWLLVAGLAAAWPGDRRRKLALCGAALGAYVLAAVLLPAALEHLYGIRAVNALDRAMGELGCSSRRVLWSNVLHLIAQRPWGGWGPGELDYAHFATLYPGERFCDILDNAHNLPLHVAVEFGVPLAVALTALLSVAVWRARPWRAVTPTAQLAWAVLALIGVHSLLEYPLWYGPFQIATLLSVALLTRDRPLAPGVRAGTCAAAMALLVLVACIWRTYDIVSQAYLPPAERKPSMRIDPVRSAGQPWMFQDQLRFAELAITDVDARTAPRVHELALDTLHYSPEPAVIEKLIESAVLLGREDEARWAIARYRAAFPDRFRAWSATARTRRAAP